MLFIFGKSFKYPTMERRINHARGNKQFLWREKIGSTYFEGSMGHIGTTELSSIVLIPLYPNNLKGDRNSDRIITQYRDTISYVTLSVPYVMT